MKLQVFSRALQMRLRFMYTVWRGGGWVKKQGLPVWKRAQSLLHLSWSTFKNAGLLYFTFAQIKKLLGNERAIIICSDYIVQGSA